MDSALKYLLPITIHSHECEKMEQLPGLNVIQRIGAAIFRIPTPPPMFRKTFRILCKNGQNMLPSDVMVDLNGVLWQVMYADDADGKDYSPASTHFAVIKSITPIRREHVPDGQLSFYG